MAKEERLLKIVRNDPSCEAKPITGFSVVVGDYWKIYQAIRISQQSSGSMVLQDEMIKDKVCGRLLSKLWIEDPEPDSDLGEYMFDLQMITKGRKHSELSFRKGYLSEDQLQQLQQGLEKSGYPEVERALRGNRHVVEFMDADGYVSKAGLGFPSERDCRNWINGQVLKEELENKMGYYRTHAAEFEGSLMNESLELRSPYFSYSKDLNREAVFEFRRNIQRFARAYETFVNLIYAINGVSAPNREIILRTGF